MQEKHFIDDNLALVKSLKKLAKFKLFTDDQLATFIAAGKFREYKPGEELMREGEYDSWVYFLINGRLEVVSGGKVVGRLQRNGDMFGEMGIIDGSPRSATIRAVDLALTLSFDAAVIDHKLKTNEMNFCYVIYRLFAEVLAARLRETTQANIELSKQLSRMGMV